MMTIDHVLNLHLPTNTTRIASARTQIDDLMIVHRYGTQDRFAVRLSLEEALHNVMKHGDNFDSRRTVRLQCLMTLVRRVLEVEDEGPGFNPDDVLIPTIPEKRMRFHGHGLHLMRRYMTRVLHSKNGRLVVMEKVRSAEPA